MSKADKASEPSMDEILASIRKIIAEEPVGSRKVAADDVAPLSAPAAKRQVSAAKSALDDVLGMADGESTAAAAADDGKPARTDTPSWLFPAQSRVSSNDTESKELFRSRPVTPETEASIDLGSIVPRRNGEAGAGLGLPPPERKPSSSRLPEWLARGPAVTPMPAAPLPSPPEPTVLPPAAREPVEPGSSGRSLAPNSSQLAASPAEAQAEIASVAAVSIPVAEGDAPIVKNEGISLEVAPPPKAPAAPSARSTSAAAPAPLVAKPEPDPVKVGIAPVKSPIAPPVTAAKTAEPVAPEPAKPSHLNGTAFIPSEEAAASKPSAIAVAPQPEAKADKTVPVPVNDAPAPPQKPAVLSERSRSVKPLPSIQAELVAAVPQATGVRTLEDTVVDLLRPMIRQWLDDNMPRMVEKALRVELAQSLKPKPESPKH